MIQSTVLNPVFLQMLRLDTQGRGIGPDDEDFAVRVTAKAETALALLQRIGSEYAPAAFASSLSAEDMVLTDLILQHSLGDSIEIFSLDTGRLPAETYALMAGLEAHYGFFIRLYYPRHEPLESWTRQHGVNAFYHSAGLRKDCCALRKIEPLQRALKGKKAWITGQRAEQSVTRARLEIQEYDAVNGLDKFNPLAGWSEREVWHYLITRRVPSNALHQQFYPSIGCAPCTRAISPGEDARAGRWWWENPESKECGLHVKPMAGG